MNCDTMVALGEVTVDKSVIFGKNSDREPNEGHELRYFPPQDYKESDMVHTTNMEIEQVDHTHAVILSSPHWIWGAEMGVNEHGVVIGNEAVFTKEPERDHGLLGMDILRLALERAKTAEEAVDVIAGLLETYGQGGNHGFQHKLKYHNSYLIADPKEAWVVETADVYWIAEKVSKFRTISNCLTIGDKYDKIHPQLIDYALKKKYCKKKDDFHFSKCFTASIFDYRTWGGRGTTRQSCTTSRLFEKKGKIDEQYVMAVLRDHNTTDPNWTPAKGSMGSICLHAKPITVPSQSTSSMVVHLGKKFITIWVTATSAPCTSLFKPIFMFPLPVPYTKRTPTGQYDSESLWWQHELIHRAILRDYQTRIKVIRPLQQQYEQKWLTKIQNLRTESEITAEQLKRFMTDAIMESLDIERQWLEALKNTPLKKRNGFLYTRYWNKRNQEAQMPSIP